SRPQHDDDSENHSHEEFHAGSFVPRRRTTTQGTQIIILRMRTVLRLIWMSLVLIIVALSSTLITMRLAIHGGEVAGPNFQGKSPAEARHLAEESGLGMQVEREYYSATIPPGRVMSQVPPSGTVVRRGWEVRLALSAGAQRTAIPQVVGDSERAAAIAIAQRSLQLGVPASVNLPGATPGQVLAQNPPANANRPTGSENQLAGRLRSPAGSLRHAKFRGTAPRKCFAGSERYKILRGQGHGDPATIDSRARRGSEPESGCAPRQSSSE